MGRSKINMELIQDHKNRKSTFMKRKASLVKKISELSILCDIKACMIIYEANNHVVSQHDHIWPNDRNEVEELINLYKNQPLEGRSKRAKTLSSFFENQKKNVENKAEKYPIWDSRFDYLSEEELRNLAGILEKKMENANEKLAEFTKNAQDSTIGSCSLSHQEIWDYRELMNNNLMNHQTISYVNPFIDYNNNFFQANISSGVNSMMDNRLLTIDDYQFGNGDSMKIEAENWLANSTGIGSSHKNWLANSTEIGSTSTMQPLMDPQQYPFIYNGGSTYGFQ